jgi:SprT protein
MRSAAISSDLDAARRRQVCAATLACQQRAERLFQLGHKPIPVAFDLAGRAAGMYRVARRRAVIRYNPHIFARYFEHGLNTTVPHEVAHYITDRLYGIANVRPHGREWRAVMAALGAEARATVPMDLAGLPVRRQQRFSYRCACETHQLSACRHNRVTAGRARYFCRSCGAELVAQA